MSYYPYGMGMPGREYSSPVYRYGFQGQERDDEVKGKGNSWNYKFRMHDPRVGRFFVVAPLAGKYLHNSVYAFSENEVIAFVELEGLEKKPVQSNEAEVNEKTSVSLPEKKPKFIPSLNKRNYTPYLSYPENEESENTDLPNLGISSQDETGKQTQNQIEKINKAASGMTGFLILGQGGTTIWMKSYILASDGSFRNKKGQFMKKEVMKKVGNISGVAKIIDKGGKVLGWAAIVIDAGNVTVELLKTEDSEWGSAALKLGRDSGLLYLAYTQPELGAVLGAAVIIYEGNIEEAKKYAKKKEVEKRRKQGELIFPSQSEANYELKQGY